MQSPLSALCETLKLVKSSAASYRQQLQKNEAVTRAVLIDPILRSLGWEVANPATVEVERPISAGELRGCLDYCLNTDNAEKPIVIEAKKLDERLEDYFPQIVRYACTLRIENLFLTDGLRWFHFTEVSASSQNPPAYIDLGRAEGSDLTKAAAFFVERLDAALYAPEPQNVEDVLQEKIDNLTKQVLDMQENISRIANGSGMPLVADPLEQSDQGPWLLLDGSWDAKGRKPVKLRLPNGHIADVKSWSQILSVACKHCLTEKTELLMGLPIVDRTGRATKLISKDKPPFNSDSFVINDEMVYVCTNYSANDSVANAKYIFDMLGGTRIKPALLLAE